MEVSGIIYFRIHLFVWSVHLTKGRWCRCLLSPLSDRIRDLRSILRVNQFSGVQKHLWIFILLQLCRRKFNDGGIQYLEHVDTDDHMKVCTKTSLSVYPTICIYSSLGTQLQVGVVALCEADNIMPQLLPMWSWELSNYHQTALVK